MEMKIQFITTRFFRDQVKLLLGCNSIKIKKGVFVQSKSLLMTILYFKIKVTKRGKIIVSFALKPFTLNEVV
jgi:hypothetical protein